MGYEIKISGGDTAAPINLKKRVSLIVSSYCGEKPPRFLDCGCGAGSYVGALIDIGWDAYGIEYLTSKITQARAAGFTEKRVVQGDIQNLEYSPDYFDALLFNEVLEHVPSDSQGLREAHRVLKSGGDLFVFSPNRLYPFETHGVRSRRTGKITPVYTPFIPYIPTPLGERIFEYLARNYWPATLQGLVRKAGFRVVSTSFVWQTFEGISGDSSKWLARLRPSLRAISSTLEQVPFLRCFGASQFVHAKK